MREPTPEQFLKDVADHKLTTMHDAGLYRHLRLRNPKSGNMWFDLVTWPGFLTISGDMGCWTFSRVEDMLPFFRSTPNDFLIGKLAINPSYWAEKLQHGQFSGREGAKVWDQGEFQKRVLAMLKEHYEFKGKKLKEITAAIEEDVFRRHDGDGPHMMRNALYEFTYTFVDPKGKKENEKFQFEGMDIPDGMVYSYHFIWCLHAIVWGIQQWDARLTIAA
jgi:hypothetical protein